MQFDKQYIQMVEKFYENETDQMKIQNHRQHDSNPDYWNKLLSPLLETNWSDKTVLEFGCGCGRNLDNILKTISLKKIFGCDISQNNIDYCINYLRELGHTNFDCFKVDGRNLGKTDSDSIDFIFSTIVLQHIAVYDIRFNILSDMYRCLTKDGICSIQMGFGNRTNSSDYYDNNYHATGTNGTNDVRVTDISQLIGDFEKIGFKEITTTISDSWCDYHDKWIFIKAKK